MARVAFRAKNQGNEIVDVRDDEIAKRRVRRFGKAKCVDIADQQGQTLDIARDPPCHAGIEVGDPCFKNGAGQPQGDVPRGSPDHHVDRIRGARQHSLALPDHRLTAALMEDTAAAQRNTQEEIVAANMLGSVPPMTRREVRQRQAESGQAAQISLETERLVAKRLDIVLYNGATVDFAIRVNSLVFRKVVRRETKHLGVHDDDAAARRSDGVAP